MCDGLCLYYFAAAQTGSTYLNSFNAISNLRLNLENIGLPHPFCLVVSVADVVSGNRAFTTNIASSGHVISLFVLFPASGAEKYQKKRSL